MQEAVVARVPFHGWHTWLRLKLRNVAVPSFLMQHGRIDELEADNANATRQLAQLRSMNEVVALAPH